MWVDCEFKCVAHVFVGLYIPVSVFLSPRAELSS